MQVGQFIYLKSSTLYAETYDVPTIQGTALGYNTGYIGKVTKLNVAGVGETQTYTEISDKYLAKRYISNRDLDKFDFTDVSPDSTTSGSGTTDTTGNSGAGGTTLDKIGSIFAGILGIFSKKTTTTTPTTTTPTTTTPTTPTDPTAGNTDNTTGIAAWVKQNVVVVIIGAIVIVGGIIWAIVAAVKADKKDKEFMMNRNQNQLNPIPNS